MRRGPRDNNSPSCLHGDNPAPRRAGLRPRLQPRRAGRSGSRPPVAQSFRCGEATDCPRLGRALREELRWFQCRPRDLLPLSPLDDGKAWHASIFFRNPSGRILVADELPHIAAIEAKGRLKAALFDGVERVEILRLVWSDKAQSNSTARGKQKAIPAMRMAFCIA